jgi:phosphate transport system substrate-binding protein
LERIEAIKRYVQKETPEGGMMKTVIRFVLVLALVFSFSHVGAADTLNGAGATFPYPVYSAWAFNYSKVSGVQLNYQSIGSGGGIRQITDRTVDFGASDAPLTPEQLEKDRLLQFPAVMGGVVPVVNIAGVKSGALKLDSEGRSEDQIVESRNEPAQS